MLEMVQPKLASKVGTTNYNFLHGLKIDIESSNVFVSY